MMLPRTLFGRTTLVIALVSIVFQVFTIAVISHFALLPLGRHATNDFASLLIGVSESWQAADSDNRPKLLQRMNNIHRLQVQDPPAPVLGAPQRPLYLLPYFHFLESALSQRTGHSITLQQAPGPDGSAWYWADMPAGSTFIRIGFPPSRITVQPSLALIIILAAGTVVTLLTSAWLAHWLIGPLRHLAEATQQIGKGRRPAPLPEVGPAELATLAHEFNRMGVEVETLLNNRTTLLAGISHDLRSPLTRIQLALGMLDDKPDADLLARIARDVNHMNQLIARCLEVGRDFAERESSRFNLCDLLAEIAREQAPGIEIHGRKGPDCQLHAKPLALRRILSNLIDNAARYGDRQPIDIEYDVTDRQVEIRILDRGPGIPEHQREAVFQPFHRLDPSRSSSTGGSGLGLAIVRQIAQANDWMVWLSPRDGGGTVAHVRLPLAE
jgi:two-component system osmolarity sensor histidine kinase EnvZ